MRVAALFFLSASAAVLGCGSQDGARAGEPRWIWRNQDLRKVEAAAFYAVREIVLDGAPAQASARIVGDEQFLLFLNGSRVGSGDRGAPGEAQEYEVGPILQPGRNRIVVELRSATGAGGFWFELVAGERRLLSSDGGWTIYRGTWRGLFGGRELLAGERPMVLGEGPLGRWGTIESFRKRPLFDDSIVGSAPVDARFWRPWGESSDWRALPGSRRRTPNLGELVEIDFGVEHRGYLQLVYRDSGRQPEPPALIRYGDVPIESPPVDADVVFSPIPGRNMYQDPIPRRFRYVAVAGLIGLYSAEVLEIDPRAVPELEVESAGEPASRGVFGVRPPPRSRSPVENKIWRELERSTGLAVGKGR